MEREGSSSYDVLAPNLEAMELVRKEGLSGVGNEFRN
jgi:hypothetical protein